MHFEGRTICLLALLAFFALNAASDILAADGWETTGEVPYSYAYARNYLGFQLRREGWRCEFGFTTGKHGEVEHSVWRRGKRRLQMMVWRIAVGRTGFSRAEIQPEKSSFPVAGGRKSQHLPLQMGAIRQ